MTKTANETDAGFTLIELITVIVILGALGAIAIPMLYSQRSKAGAASAVSDLRNAATFEEGRYAQVGDYSSNLSDLVGDGFHRSPQVKLGITASSAGYCAAAQSGSKFFWFDSNAGGIQSGSTTTLSPPASANGACATSAPSQVS
jgi:prepilin-type N-terminal cleavage/methylation domain-containing protein